MALQPVIKVNDLSLAAYLNYRGVVHDHLELMGKKCIWVFPDTDALDEHTEDWHAKACELNDVQEFVSTYLSVREQMFEHLAQHNALRTPR